MTSLYLKEALMRGIKRFTALCASVLVIFAGGCGPRNNNGATATVNIFAPTPFQCNNGVDDDGDGKIDFGRGPNNDPGCDFESDNTEDSEGTPTPTPTPTPPPTPTPTPNGPAAWLRAVPETIVRGNSSVLSWDCVGTTNTITDETGRVISARLRDTQQVSPSETMWYSQSCSEAGRTTTNRVRLVVTPGVDGGGGNPNPTPIPTPTPTPGPGGTTVTCTITASTFPASISRGSTASASASCTGGALPAWYSSNTARVLVEGTSRTTVGGKIFETGFTVTLRAVSAGFSDISVQPAINQTGPYDTRRVTVP